jgi:hypothetical protein
MPRHPQTGFGQPPKPGARPAEPWQRRGAVAGPLGWASVAASMPPAVAPTVFQPPAFQPSVFQPSASANTSHVAAFAPGHPHPLADRGMSQTLRLRAEEIDDAFDAIEPVLRALAPHQFEDGFSRRATSEILAQLRLDMPAEAFAADWTRPLDMAALYARCVVGTYLRLIERGFDRNLAHSSDGEPADVLVKRWGFHAVDITPCADGRLSGVIDYILRVPPSVVAYRQSYAGALFDVARSLRHWESTELRRWRTGQPNAADAPTRYLKMAVYHFSSVDPHHQGCAAHGSDGDRAAASLLERLDQFAVSP